MTTNMNLRATRTYFENHLERKGKEIRWQGKMYDIKWLEYLGAKVIVGAIHDKKEYSLIAQLSDHLREKDKQGHRATKSFIKLLKLEFLKNEETPAIVNFFSIDFCKEKVKQTLIGFPGFDSPPPRII